MLSVLCPNAKKFDALRVDGEPRSKARPRFSGKGHVYVDEKQRAAEKTLAWEFKRAFKEPLPGNLAVVCLFYRSSNHRIDTDNLLKQVMDAANGIVWKDDYQVTAILGLTECDPQLPRTYVAIAPHESTMDRSPVQSKTCARCGETYTPQSKRAESTRRYCSTACASRSRGEDLRAEVACFLCKVPFRRTTARQRFCSAECGNKYRSLGKQKRVHPNCVECGVVIPNYTAKRCRSCYLNRKRKSAT
jgi:Holliday junction resolvase RusA-like endonuclease